MKMTFIKLVRRTQQCLLVLLLGATSVACDGRPLLVGTGSGARPGLPGDGGRTGGADGAIGGKGTGGAGTGGLGASATGGQPWQTPENVDAPVRRLRPDEVPAEAIPTRLAASAIIVGAVDEHVFLCTCSGGQLSSGCGMSDLAEGRAPALDHLPMPSQCARTAVWGSSDHDIYFPGAWHFDGQALAMSPVVAACRPVLEITGTSPADLWTGGSGAICHVQGTKLSMVPGRWTYTAGALQAAGEDELWAIARGATGDEGRLVHFAQDHWSETGLGSVSSVAVSGTDNLWAVDATFIYHFDGVRWTQSRDPLTLLGEPAVPLRAVSTSGPSDVWVTGDDNLLRHWNGQRWELLPLGNDSKIWLGKPWLTPSALWVLGRDNPAAPADAPSRLAFRLPLFAN